VPTSADVASDALVYVGQAGITNLDDGTINANRCKQFYEPTVDAILRSARWKCAKFFKTLEAVAGWSNARWSGCYQLPADPYCLRVWDVNNDDSVLWTVSGDRQLLTDTSTAFIEYVGRVTNPTLWDALLYEAITAALASKLAIPILRDFKVAAGLKQIALQNIELARSVDGQEGSIETLTTPDLINVRGDGETF